MVQVYADGRLVYDSRLDDCDLLALTVKNSIEKAGTAEIVMPPFHPAYNWFVSYKTIITVCRDGRLLFRGRPLYPEDDFYNQRTVTCEGERCFLRDAVIRPYLYQTDPATIFADLVRIYNEQVEPEKQFAIGNVTVTESDGYIRIENESASQVSEAIDKLVERVGGYIVFDDAPSGKRRINWLVSLDSWCGQTIEFGENLLDFSRSGSNTDLLTAIVPYGAKDETTGKRVTIETVNGGLDYLQDNEAVALRGFIAKPVYWDDVTVPSNLLKKARAYLDANKLIVTSLELSAVDLSAMDKSIDSFNVGDWVRVRSKPHGVDDVFLLRERSYNLLDPAQDKVMFGKQMTTLTGADVISDQSNANRIQQAQQSLAADIGRNNATISSSIMQEVAVSYGSKVNESGRYMTADGLLLQWGKANINPTVQSYTYIIYGNSYSEIPILLVTPVVSTPSGIDVGVTDSTLTSAKIVLSGATTTTALNWLAIGPAGLSADDREEVLAITEQPVSIMAEVGETVTFSVGATSAVSYQWQYSSDGESWTNSGIAGNKNATFNVAVTAARYPYLWRCVVTDANGNTLASDSVKILQPIVITQQPVASSAAVDEQAEFIVEATGVVTYQWQYSKNGTSWTDTTMNGNKTARLYFKVTEVRRTQLYRCVLTDEVGNVVYTDAVGFQDATTAET